MALPPQNVFCVNKKIETTAIYKDGKMICQACGEEIPPVIFRQKSNDD